MNTESIAENIRIAESVEGLAASTPSSNAQLSDTALVLLSGAANRHDGSVLPPPADLKTRGSALKAVLTRLLARRLIEEVPVDSDAESWRQDEETGRVGLRITAAGCSAIGVEMKSGDDSATVSVPDGRGAIEPASDTSQQNANVEPAGELGDETGDTVEIIEGSAVRPTVEVASIDGEAEGGGGLADSSAGASSSRPSSKQVQIIVLLSREEGATIDGLMAVTGWLPHTVRAVLSGLRKKGHRIDRQKDGDAGSVYRILQDSPVEAAPPAKGEAV